MEDEPALRTALGLFEAGADFADAIHLVGARGTAGFISFDRKVPDGAALGVAVELAG